MSFDQKRRPRVRLRSSFGHLRFLAKSAGRGSGFGVVSVTYDFWPKAQAAGQASEARVLNSQLGCLFEIFVSFVSVACL